MDAHLLKALACPKCQSALQSIPDGIECTPCGVVYPVRDEIPELLIDAAIPRADWNMGRRFAIAK